MSEYTRTIVKVADQVAASPLQFDPEGATQLLIRDMATEIRSIATLILDHDQLLQDYSRLMREREYDAALKKSEECKVANAKVLGWAKAVQP